MEVDVISNAVDKKYTDFSNAIKQELKNKLANNPDVKQYTSDFDKIQDMKALFNKINTDFGEKKVEPVVEPEKVKEEE
jgi:hypothetical protein